MSENCETFEILVSTWLDEGLDRRLQRELLDHFVRCAECRRFYREARSLEGLVAVTEPETAPEPAPEAVWEQIERRAGREPRPGRRGVEGSGGISGWRRWAIAAAAALVVGIALPFVPWPAGGTDRAAAPIDILLEENRDEMTETRFVELTTELLQADRKYHFAMQDVMEAVIEGSWESEGATSEGDIDERADEDDDERRSRIRT